MIFKSFGCSFVWGSELPDETPGIRHSNLTWPALLAQEFGAEYQCRAWPGRGNLFIAQQILQHAQPGDTILVNWTYIDRFDYVNPDNQQDWQTCRPSGAGPKSDLYYRNFHSQYRDKITNLMTISHCVQQLARQDIRCWMSYHDHLLFETEWHTDRAVAQMQQYLRPWLHTFDGDNFVEWAGQQGHAKTNQGHLLESGHRAVADHLLKTAYFQ